MSSYNPAADPLAASKRAAAQQALAEVRAGMRVGLGTGSTAFFVIEGLGQLVAAGLDVVAVPTSDESARLARQWAIPVAELMPAGLDVAIDGADEIDPAGQLIKGRGGALLREKLVALAARRFIVVADNSKCVAQLGQRFAVPVEVVPWGFAHTAARLAAFGPVLRCQPDGAPYVTDNGNWIVDCAIGPMADPAATAAQLKATVGVVETGLFLGLTRRVILAGAAGIVSREH